MASVNTRAAWIMRVFCAIDFVDGDSITPAFRTEWCRGLSIDSIMFCDGHFGSPFLVG